MQIAILGRQPKLSLAELESIFGYDLITPIGDYAAIIDQENPLPQIRLGGTIKSATIVQTLDQTDFNQTIDYVERNIMDLIGQVPDGKIKLGFSIYGFKASKKVLQQRSLQIKKQLRQAGKSVRIIQNNSISLDAAQVIYNKLTGSLGREILIVKNGKSTIIAQTTAVQNIDDYAARDHGRPKRDAYVGMLPPKLAQIMINLTGARSGQTLLDPFCGTGVILQEALLMGINVVGSDISDRIVSFSQENIAWLIDKNPGLSKDLHSDIQVADATKYKWKPQIDAVATEVYLGKPLRSWPDQATLYKQIEISNSITKAFLQNLASQIKSGTRICLALPLWQKPKSNQVYHLPVLDRLRDLGYNRLDLKLASSSDLVYARPDQIVTRELTILEKI